MYISSCFANIINTYISKFLTPMYFHKKRRLPLHPFSAPCYTSHTGLTAFQRSQAGSIRRKTARPYPQETGSVTNTAHSCIALVEEERQLGELLVVEWLDTILRHHGLGQGDPDSHGKCRLILFFGVQLQEQLQVLHSNIFPRIVKYVYIKYLFSTILAFFRNCN